MIRKADINDLSILAALSAELWPSLVAEEMNAELQMTMEREDAAFFLAFLENKAIGFAQCGLRRDYVEGTSSSPVGYLEGVYVREANRRLGVAGQLLKECEEWARAKGCTEFASDCEIDNEMSFAFHLRLGFKEENRIICFTKKL